MKLKRNYGKLYQDYNNNHEKQFSGKLNHGQITEIKNLVDQFQPVKILDYGSGKGYQYLSRRQHEQWGGLLPYCYDPGVIQLADRPKGLFDGVICTDVMEHIDQDDVDLILADVFAFINPNKPAFAYFHVCTRPAGKSFDDGENVHLTVQPAEWWSTRISRFNRDNLTTVSTYGD